MKSTEQRIMQEFDMGYIPYELSYGLDPSNQIKVDWTSFCYNEHNRLEYWINREDPYLLEQWPCLLNWVEEKWQQNKDKTPLEELEERRKDVKAPEINVMGHDGITVTFTEIEEEKEEETHAEKI